MNKVVKYNVDSIKKMKMRIVNNYEELMAMFKIYQKLIDETKTVCETEAADAYREMANKYIEQVLNEYDSKFNNHLVKLDLICQRYDEERSTIFHNVDVRDEK